MTTRTLLAGLVPVARQRSVLANSTAIAVNSTVRAAKPNILMISVETNSARMSAAGAPTLTTGVLLLTGVGPYWIEGYNGTSALRFQRDTGTSVVNIEAFQQAGA